MKYIVATILLFILLQPATAQVVNTAVMDTTDFRYQGKFTVEGYIDSYFAYDFNKPRSGDRPYAVSMHRHNEMTINLAFIDLKYSSSRLRARFVPGFGTYINANYAGENTSLKNIVEASAGVKLFADKNIWVDVGVFGSPYTNESAISKDHLAYTRSFAPEFVPYYLSGVKLSLPVASKINFYLYLLNGWQQIGDSNNNKALGTQLELRPNNYWLVNWNTFIGNENSVADPTVGTRYFTDLFFIYTKDKWSVTGCAYVGAQERATTHARWWTTNLIGRYSFTEKFSVSMRAEYFEDMEGVQIIPLNGANGFSTFSSSVGVNLAIAENVLFRTEGRFFQSDQEAFSRAGEAIKNSTLLTTSLTIWF